jgi:hypothetical protein
MFKPLKPKFIFIRFKNSVRTSKRKPHVTISKINGLILFKEAIPAYSEKYNKPIDTKCGSTDFNVGGT